MITEAIHVPPIFNGSAQTSLSRVPVTDFLGNTIGTVSQQSPIRIRKAVRLASTEGYNALRELSIDSILEIYHQASHIFRGNVDVEGFGVSISEYAELVCKATGLPRMDAMRAAGLISKYMTKSDMKRVLQAASPDGSLAAYDDNLVTRGGTDFAWIPRGRSCAVVLPSNHPAVGLLAVLLPAMKIPTVLRASNKEPYTAHRLTNALLDAGLPTAALQFVTSEQSAVNSLLDDADLGIVFGSEWTVQAYSSNPRIKAMGPGRSKIIVTADADTKQAVDMILASMAADSGRGCINNSALIIEDGAEDPSHAVAERLGKLPITDPLGEKAVIGASNHAMATQLSNYVASRMQHAENMVETWKEPLVKNKHGTFMVPQLFKVEYGDEHFGDEYPYIFGTTTTVPRDQILDAARHSLSIALIGDDPALANELLMEPTISKVYRGKPTNAVDLAQPHEGFMTDFLYTNKAWF